MGIKLTDVAEVIRSKNSGPYELTFDIIFKSREWYEKVKLAKVINKNFFSRLYNMPDENILDIIEFDPASAVKITVRRPLVSGNVGDTDIYGAQQHAPLLTAEFEL